MLAKNGYEFVADEKEAEDDPYGNGMLVYKKQMGGIKEQALAGFQKIVERMQRENGIEAVILGCTELPLLLSDSTSPVACLDTMKIHIARLVDMIVE